jgi:DNA polymerase-3 subunit epsilon
MSDLRDLSVLALDCQAAGATPAYGDLLELGWTVCTARNIATPVQSCWIVPRTERPVGRAVRELTGWTEACLASAVAERDAWLALSEDLAPVAARTAAVPTVIHFARFELPFLRDLHHRLGDERAFPFDTICLHAIAVRFFPDLPRRNIRALAGYLGHSPGLVRRCAGHVEATAFIWSALVPLLEQAGIGNWSELKSWLDQRAPRLRRAPRVYPLAPERRRALPDRYGVYRFLRRNGDVLYVGKAASLKKRVASHFNGHARATERGLELLTQVHDVRYTETPSLLEAALLECDEIQRLDPPYNVQLRTGDRSAWFASRDLRNAASKPDAVHRLGPLPSERALSAFSALTRLAEGAEPTLALRANALAVPVAYLPEESLFRAGWREFTADYLAGRQPASARHVACVARALWLLRARAEPEAAADESAPEVWDLARVRRRLERHLVQGGLLLRRARWLCLLADASVAFRERDAERARLLEISAGRVLAQREIDAVLEIRQLPRRRPRGFRERQSSFDAASYDRLRVLSTELRRVHDDGGEVALRVGAHTLAGEQLARLIREV